MQDWLAEETITARTGADRRRLTWLRQNGLIPPPRRQSRGLHKGTASWYPPVTIEMIRRIDALKAKTRNADHWRWCLWLEGFPIEIGKHLAASIDEILEPFAGIRDAGDLDNALLSTRLRRPGKRNTVPAKRSAGRLLYARVRKPAAWHSLLSWSGGIGLGFDVDGTAFDAVVRAFKLPADWRLPPIDKSNASLAVLKDALLNMSPAEIEQGRKDMSVVSELADRLCRFSEAEHAPAWLKFLRGGWDEFISRAMLVAFLTMLRRSPDTAEGVDNAVNAVRWLLPKLATLEAKADAA
jgi:hypothetical protein